jgi:hypothetical protein
MNRDAVTSYEVEARIVEPGRSEVSAKQTAIAYEVRVPTDEDERRCALLHRNLRTHGPEVNTLAEACEVSGELIAERSAPV